jgi:hypothetical protein
MRTNLSRFTVSFSDHSWNDEGQKNKGKEEDMFPQAWKVGEYLKSYANRFLPRETLRLSCRVIRAQRNQDENNTSSTRKWTVEWVDQNHSDGAKGHLSESFDYLVVASGYFSRPYIPSITGLDQFPQDRVMHSSSLRSNSQILTSIGGDDSKILVVGGSMSGAETAASIALDLSSTNKDPKTTKSVHHITSRPFWAVPTYLPVNGQPGSFLPLDIVMNDLARRPPGDIQYALGPVTSERANMVHSYFESLLGTDQSDVAEELAHKANSDERNKAPWVAVTDHYAGFVRCGDIVPTLGRVSATHWTGAEAEMKGVVEIEQDDGETVKLDNVAAIVLATGFIPFESLSFLPQDVLQSLEYTENDTVFPIVLDEKGVRNPHIPDLGFVGMYRGPYWGVMEMQARSLARQWSDQLDTHDAVGSDITKVKDMRSTSSRAQFPMGDYVGLMETFARELQIPRKSLQDNTTERSGPAIPARYFVSTNTDETSTSNSGIITSLQNLLLDPTEPSSNHKERQRGLSKAILRALHGHWRYEREILPESKTVTGQASIRLRTASFNEDAGFITEFVYEEDPSTTQQEESKVTFQVSEDGHIHTTRQDATTGRLSFINVEKVDDDNDASYQYRYFAREGNKTSSDIERKYIFNMRGTMITSWKVTVQDKRTKTATVTKYRR